MVESREWSYEGGTGQRVARTWQGGSAPDHVLLLAHGYGEHLGRYEHVADALTANGAVVYAVDHVGHGRSDGERALVETFEDVVSDLHVLAETAVREHPGLPVVLLGHSMGGLIASRYAQRYTCELTALVLSGPLIGAWEAGPFLLSLQEMPDIPLDITTLSRDPSVGAAYAADPLVWHGPFKRPTVQAMVQAVEAVQSGPDLGGLPLLWVHGADDTLVPLVGSRVGIEHLGGPDVEQHLYEGARHEIFNETNADEVLADVCGFIRRTLGAPGPG